MMPQCYHTNLLGKRCSHGARHLHWDASDFELAACDKHEGWYKQTLLKHSHENASR